MSTIHEAKSNAVNHGRRIIEENNLSDTSQRPYPSVYWRATSRLSGTFVVRWERRVVAEYPYTVTLPKENFSPIVLL